ncbi:hypothetical protein SCARR_05150 [Pontiella sulfatireligans]|uniref:Glycosyl hydrolase family 32 N-terminal domain-containing protein n=2 Tax=Pontiella sulfatireligans TaxID=2750658 RepID=A0A6C2UUL6_9BACT|nr:hypothetical protein SCARR_05150 [Pontiella sulfatireligans]
MKYYDRKMLRVLRAAPVALVLGFVGACVAEGALMQRMSDDPVFAIDPAHPWRSVHVANAAVLSPAESPDGRWLLYIRGSGYLPEPNGKAVYHDSIGLFTQEADSFSPLGPWEEYSGNPVLIHGPEEAFDGKHLLDCTPVVGRDATGKKDLLHMFYKGVSYKAGGCLAVAVSSDGGISFAKFETNPLQRRIGPCDVVYHDNRYYIFYGDAKYDPAKKKATARLKTYLAVVNDPAEFTSAPKRLVLDTGVRGSFDSQSVHGGRIFKLNNRWYMVYQCSSEYMDYPDRFHVAWSDDLLQWKKIESPELFFTRGPAGSWDEGAIWCGEVFTHKDMLYMYYEGWGSGRKGFDRDKPYFRGGRSQTGLAVTSVESFLKWCGHSDRD